VSPPHLSGLDHATRALISRRYRKGHSPRQHVMAVAAYVGSSDDQSGGFWALLCAARWSNNKQPLKTAPPKAGARYRVLTARVALCAPEASMRVRSQRAGADEARGYLLTRARHARGWTQSDTARRLRELSRERGRPLCTGRDGVWYWEHRRTPDRPTQLLIAELLGIPLTAVDERPWPEWLSEDPAQRPAPRPWTLLGATQSLNDLAGGAMDVTRRKLVLIAGQTLTGSLLAWLTADPVAAGQLTTGRCIGEAAVTKVEDRAQMLRPAGCTTRRPWRTPGWPLSAAGPRQESKPCSPPGADGHARTCTTTGAGPTSTMPQRCSPKPTTTKIPTGPTGSTKRKS